MSNTTVSLTAIQDPSGQIWDGAVVSYSVLAMGLQILYNGEDIPEQFLAPQNIVLDSSGDGSFVVPDSADITPVNTLWKVVINPNSTSQGVTVYIFITGSTMDISDIINAAIATPSVRALLVPRAYDDSQITPVNLDGQLYFNTGGDEGLRVWQDGAFVAVGGGSGGGFTVSGTPSNDSNVPVYDGGAYDTATWRQLTQDDILPGFAIDSFSGGSTVEIGATVTNPTFDASYSSTPDSAEITNTDGTDSPLTLTTPFTSGTVTGSFSKGTATSVTFTLSATKSGNTKTATQAIGFEPRNFCGVGDAGATGATASGDNADLTGATGTLDNSGIFNSPVGVNFGTVNPSAQKVYILTTGGSHTFKDALTGFAFAFNTPTAITFDNQESADVDMYLYESANTLSGPYQPECLS